MPRLIDKEIKENLKIFGAASIENPKWCGKNHANSVVYLNIIPEKLMNYLNTFDFYFETLVERDLKIYA